MSRTLRVAQIGAGGIGQVHAKNYAQVNGAELQVIVDLDDARARDLQERFRIPERALDYREVLRRKDIDVIDICLPTWLHEEVAVAAARAGKHVLCEKPMSLTVESTERMRDEAQRAGVALMIALCRRYSNEWLKARELIRAGALGRPVVWRSVVAVRGGKQAWFVQMGRGNGPFVDAAVHNYDFARYTFGEVAQVTASTLTFRDDATAPDTGTALIRFVSGDELVVCWSWGLPSGAKAPALNDVIGPRGVLYFQQSQYPKSGDLPPLEPGQGAVIIDRGEGGVERHLYERNDMVRDEIQAFIDAIHQGIAPPIDADVGVESQRIAQAVLDSGATGMPIQFRNRAAG